MYLVENASATVNALLSTTAVPMFLEYVVNYVTAHYMYVESK